MKGGICLMNIEDELKKNLYKLFKLDLAFESYMDDTNDDNFLLNEIIMERNNFMKEQKSKNIEEQYKLTTEMLKKYNNILDIVGRDNFIFYDDGDINYIWKGSKRNG